MRLAASLLLLLIGLPGCNQGRPFEPVRGAVSFKGQPLNQGRIEFLPLDRQGTAQGAMIANGVYEIPAEKGLLPGRYQVQVFSPDYVHVPPTGPIGAAPAAPAPKDRVSSKFNLRSSLSAEIKAGRTNVFDFQVD